MINVCVLCFYQLIRQLALQRMIDVSNIEGDTTTTPVRNPTLG